MHKCSSTMLVNINIHIWNISGSERCLKYVLRRYSFHFYHAFWIVITFAFNMVSTVQSAFEWPFEFLYSYKLFKIYNFSWRSWVANTDHIGSLLKLQKSDRRIQMSHRQLQTTTGEPQTTTDGSQMTTDEPQTTIDGSQMTTDESQTTTNESQASHRRLYTNYSESFFEYIYKTLFSERIWFSKCSYEKVVFT